VKVLHNFYCQQVNVSNFIALALTLIKFPFSSMSKGYKQSEATASFFLFLLLPSFFPTHKVSCIIFYALIKANRKVSLCICIARFLSWLHFSLSSLLPLTSLLLHFLCCSAMHFKWAFAAAFIAIYLLWPARRTWFIPHFFYFSDFLEFFLILLLPQLFGQVFDAWESERKGNTGVVTTVSHCLWGI